MGSIIQLFRSKSAQQRGQSKQSPKQQFESLVGPHIELMYRMAYRWTQSQEDAEDLVQDVLIKLADKVDEMQAVESLKPWLIKILYRRFVDVYRKSKASPVVDLHIVEDEDGPASPPQNWLTSPSEEHRLALQQTLMAALNTLDDDQKDMAMLHFVEGYTALEAAEILGINEGTAKSRLQRARIKLKNFLSSEPF